MPIVARDSGLIEDLRLHKTIETKLPDWPQLAASRDRLAGVLGKKYLSALSASIWQEAAQKSLGAVTSNVGQPSGDVFLSMVAAMELDEIALDMISPMLEKFGIELANATQKALQDTMENGIGIAADVASAIPVVGWVVRIAWSVGKAIHTLVSLSKQGDERASRIDRPAAFSADLDNYSTSTVISLMATSQNWTDVFMPPGVGRIHQTTPWFTKMNLPGGFRIKSAALGGPAEDFEYQHLWMGYAPGTKIVTRMYEFYDRAPFFLDTGTYLPSLRNLGVTAWGLVTKNSPSQFTVDVHACKSAWAQYLGTLRDWVQQTDMLSAKRKRDFTAAMNDPNRDGVHDGIGWTTYHPSDKVGNWKGYGVEDCRPVLELEKLRQHQKASLDTLTCAYVTSDFAAFRNDSELRDLHDQRRRQLLNHPDICHVDLENIPDAEFFEEAKKRGAGSPSCSAVIGNLDQKPKTAIPFVKPSKATPFYQGSTSRGSGALAVAAAALAAFAIASRRK